MIDSAIVRFWNKVDRSQDCWLWTGNKSSEGYGRFQDNKKVYKAHRWIFAYENGPIPAGLVVRHSCDVRHCVRHLVLGTQMDNVLDAMERKRNPCGEKIGTSKLKESDVLEIRGLKGILSNRQIAKRFGVGPSAIDNIMLKKTWRHL